MTLAITACPGTTGPISRTVAAGAAVSADAAFNSLVLPSGSSTVRLSLQLSVNGGGFAEVAANEVVATTTEPANLSAGYTYTNTTGATAVAAWQVVMTRSGGATIPSRGDSWLTA